MVIEIPQQKEWKKTFEQLIKILHYSSKEKQMDVGA